MKIINYEEFDKSELYFCYSPKLYIFLKYMKDLHPIEVRVNNRTGKTYSVFVKGEQLQACLDEWKENKISGNLAVKGGGTWIT